jgi:hypothetical protein
MAFTQADLTNIRSCIASGVMRTRFADGREVQYQSLADMMKAEQRIAEALVASAPGGGGARIRRPSYRNGC